METARTKTGWLCQQICKWEQMPLLNRQNSPLLGNIIWENSCQYNSVHFNINALP